MTVAFAPGARLLARPDAAKPCATCLELIGRGYPTCAECASSVDGFWLADWRELVAAQGVRVGDEEEVELARWVVDAEVGEFPWTCTDWAMRLIRCAVCACELGTGDVECMPCTTADQARWAWDFTGMARGAMTGNEHALRVAVAVLRTRHRRRESVVAGYRLLLPLLLTGATPTNSQAQRIRALVLAGRYAELTDLHSFAEMAQLPEIPWRARLS